MQLIFIQGKNLCFLGELTTPNLVLIYLLNYKDNVVEKLSVIPEGFCTAVSIDTAIIWALFRPPKLKKENKFKI